nr:putative ribonuclease H-like domain-containing protein [Tanacetum cinerariifolium]
MCDKKNSVLFTNTECLVLSSNFKLPDASQVLLRVPRENNMYNVNLRNIIPSGDLTCLFAKATLDESNLWYRRLDHVNFKTINKLVKGNLVRGLPIKVFTNKHTFVACMKGKHHRASCKAKSVSSVDQLLFRLHMDLFGPTFVKSLSKKSYCLVITNDHNRFSWVFFLASKDETASVLKTFIIGLENLLSLKVKLIRCDNGTEFKNSDLNQFCGLKGIKREFSIPRTPQQNGIAERKNRTLSEAARTLLADSRLPIPFWAEAVNTACYVQNRVLVTKTHNKTPYELLHGRLPSTGFMRPFGCPFTILNTLDPLGKFQGKVDECFLIGYSVCSKAFSVFNSITRTVQEILHVNFMENKPNVEGSGPSWLSNIDSLTRTMNYLPVTAENQTNTHAGFQDTKKAGEEGTHTYVLFPVLSNGFTDSQINNKDVLVDGKEHDDNIQKFVSPDIHSSSSGAQPRNQGDKTENKDKGKSPVITITGFRDLNEEFEECINNSSNGANAAGSSVFAAGLNFTNSTNDFSVAGPSNTAASPLVENSTLQNVSTSSHYADMPNLEDYTHSNDADDVGAEAGINNLESTVLDPSWIEAMQEELLQFKLQKVWILVDLPYGKRAIGTKWVYRNKKDERDRECWTLLQRKAIALLVHWNFVESKAIVIVATSSTEAEYVAATSGYAQVLWMQNQLLDYCDSPLLGVNAPRSDEDGLKLMELMVFLLQKNVCVEIGINFWNTAVVKRSSNVTRLQALVDKKRIVITEEVVREILQLNDAEGVICQPNEEIFAGLARMGYEKPSTKLTFYKAFFLTQWKLFIHNILHSLSVNSKFYMYPWFIQLIIQTNISELSTHTTRYSSLALTQKVFENMRRVGKGFSGVETPLFEKEVVTEDVPPTPTPPSPPSLVIPSSPPHQPPWLKINMVKSSKLRRLKKVGTSQHVESSNDMENVFNQGRIITDMDQDEGIDLVADQEKDAKVKGRHVDKQAELYNLNLDHSSKVVAASTPIPAAKPKSLNIATAPAVSTRRRKGVVIRDPEEELPSNTAAETPKNAALDHIQSKEPQYIKRYHGMKKKPQTEYEARKNMILYLKNTEGYKMDFFKGMNQERKWKKDKEIIKSINETPVRKAAKRRKLHEQAKEDEDLKKQLEVVDDEDDDVFIEATPIGRKVPVVDYEIVMINNKPRYKIIKADGTH